MALWAFGINHKTASVDVREQVAFSPESMRDAHERMCAELNIDEGLILSTCNRTEIVVHGAITETQILEWLSSYHEIAASELAKCTYSHVDSDAVNHLMRVACGLDSLVLGEPQILGQVKSAYAVAKEAGTVSGPFHHLFQTVFNTAKSVRTKTAIGANPVSVAFAAVSLSQRIFSSLKETNALLIGAGETIDLVAQHLHQKGVHNMVVANRTLTRAEELAARFDARAVLLSDIPDELPAADIIISSTASQLPILGKGMVESALRKRKHRPQFMVDIAVPRDIEAEVGQLDDVYLYTVDDLKEVIDEGKRSRATAAEEAVGIIEQAVQAYVSEVRAQDVVGTIKSYRDLAHEHKENELLKALKSLETGADAEKVLSALARNLTNKIIHAPTVALSKAAKAGRIDVIDTAKGILGLEETNWVGKEHEKVDS